MRRRRIGIAALAALVAATIAALGGGLALLPERGGKGLEPVVAAAIAPAATPPAVTPPPVLPPATASFDELFHSSITQMRDGRPHDALVTLEAARQLRPDQPEVLINMGFIFLDRGAPGDARLLFERALQLRPSQLNAYYGLAAALEAAGDLDGAIGAMRTYLHRSPAEDPFRRRAMSALWEWESRRAEAAPAP